MCHCGNLINTWNITNISPTRGMKPNLNFLKLKGVDIFQQLIVEEFLMRKCSKNWYIFNHGIKIPQIVLGFSGKVKELVDTNLVKLDNIPLIKRFTGGGTVIVDKSTIFGTFIMNESDADTPPYPREIMKWSTEFYANSFKIKNQDLTLNEHDYCIGDLKIGGNAQAIIKSRSKLLINFYSNPKYEKIFPFHRIAKKAVNVHLPLKFKKVADYYVRKAGYKTR